MHKSNCVNDINSTVFSNDLQEIKIGILDGSGRFSLSFPSCQGNCNSWLQNLELWKENGHIWIKMQYKEEGIISFCKQEIRIGLYLCLESGCFGVFFIVVVFMFCNAVERLVTLEKYQIILFSPLSLFFPLYCVYIFPCCKEHFSQKLVRRSSVVLSKYHYFYPYENEGCVLWVFLKQLNNFNWWYCKHFLWVRLWHWHSHCAAPKCK